MSVGVIGTDRGSLSFLRVPVSQNDHLMEDPSIVGQHVRPLKNNYFKPCPNDIFNDADIPGSFHVTLECRSIMFYKLT